MMHGTVNVKKEGTIVQNAPTVKRWQIILWGPGRCVRGNRGYVVKENKTNSQTNSRTLVMRLKAVNPNGI